MESFNQITLIGNIDGDLELKTSSAGNPCVKFVLSTSDCCTNWNGEKVDTTEWHNVTFFGKAAEMLANRAKKGTSLFLQGSIKSSKYTDKDGHERVSFDIVGKDFKFITIAPTVSGSENSLAAASDL